MRGDRLPSTEKRSANFVGRFSLAIIIVKKFFCKIFLQEIFFTALKEFLKIWHELFVAHEKYLPQFADTIQQLKAQKIYPQDEVVQKLLAEGK